MRPTPLGQRALLISHFLTIRAAADKGRIIGVRPTTQPACCSAHWGGNIIGFRVRDDRLRDGRKEWLGDPQRREDPFEELGLEVLPVIKEIKLSSLS